ncbi:MAG: hypothetical protein NUW02_00870 [Candidatus Campbellbacteria bacterium]|nr:hypothetical protein [Candidatus Campbellbacteria bacterium]
MSDLDDITLPTDGDESPAATPLENDPEDEAPEVGEDGEGADEDESDADGSSAE